MQKLHAFHVTIILYREELTMSCMWMPYWRIVFQSRARLWSWPRKSRASLNQHSLFHIMDLFVHFIALSCSVIVNFYVICVLEFQWKQNILIPVSIINALAVVKTLYDGKLSVLHRFLCGCGLLNAFFFFSFANLSLFFSVTWFVYGKSLEMVNSMITEFINATVIVK